MNIPNSLSVFRILLTLPLVWVIVNEDFIWFGGLLLLSGFTDWLDGWIARSFQQQTSLGAWLDPLADKILLNSIFIALTWINYVPWFVAGIILCRDFGLILGASLFYRQHGAPEGQANLLGKLSTLCQFAFVGVVCINHLLPNYWFNLFSNGLLILVFGLTLASGIVYFRIWGHQIYTVTQPKE